MLTSWSTQSFLSYVLVHAWGKGRGCLHEHTGGCGQNTDPPVHELSKETPFRWKIQLKSVILKVYIIIESYM